MQACPLFDSLIGAATKEFEMAKPEWTPEQIVAQLTNKGGAWDNQQPIAYAFYETPADFMPSLPSFSAFSAEQRQSTAYVLDMLAEVANLSFTEVPDNGEIPSESNQRIGLFNIDSANSAYWGAMIYMDTELPEPPTGEIYGADIVVNLNRASVQGGWDPGDSNTRKLMHEIMHALGIDHPGPYNGDGPTYEENALFLQDSVQYTVMSYWAAAKTGADHVGDGVLHHAATPLLYDIAALQSVYGANMSTRTGNTVYGFNSNTGDSPFNFQLHPGPVIAIWDAGGRDTLDLSGYSTGSVIDLNQGGFSSGGGLTKNIAIAFGAVIEDATGGAGNDSITGNQAANLLIGKAGNDVILGGAGNDLMDGGSGNDSLNGGGGIDAVTYAQAVGGVVVDLSLSGGQDTVGAGVDSLSGVENVLGSAYADKLRGNGGGNLLDGGAGADTLKGGAGNDIYVIDNAGDKVVEAAGGGTDIVQSRIGYTLSVEVENLLLTGTNAVNGLGNGSANTLTGNAAANVLDGKGGADALRGEGGNDTYVVDNAGDVVKEGSATGGTDLVKSSVSFTLGTYVENLTLIGSGAINGTGNGGANVVIGNGAANKLDGGGGADKLYGGAGKDALKGGAGADGFYMDTALSASSNVDAIGDFSAADDTIFLSRSIFKSLSASGTLGANAFHTGTAAHDASDRIIYDKASGKIFYDADGMGGAAAVLFATVTAGTALTNADFSGY
jgi:Ca2+-binding RTX toxin-like protein